MEPRVDIIIPVFNQVKFTEACLNSLYRNTDPKRFHVVVVDNASTDETQEFLKAFQSMPGVKETITLVTNPENYGWCKGLNQGFRNLHKDSEYVLWCNNDILFEAGWLDAILKHFKAGIGAVGPTSNYVMGRQNVAYNYGHAEEAAPRLIGFFLMFRKEVIDLVGDVDERFWPGGSEEYDYIIRMRKDLGFQCMIARDVYIHHFGSKTLMPFVGNTAEGYNSFTDKQDGLLKEKWGEETCSYFLDYWQKTVLVGVPHPGIIHHKFWKDSIALLSYPGSELWDVPGTSNTSMVPEARNDLVREALKRNFKSVMFVDSDMRIPNNTMFKLLEHNKPIVAGYFFARKAPHFPCAFRKPFEKWKREDGLVSFFQPNTGLQEVDAVGMACTLIDTKVFKELQDPWFKWGMYGEDNGFCLDVRDKGFKIFVDTDLIIKHIPMYEEKEIGPEDYNPDELPERK